MKTIEDELEQFESPPEMVYRTLGRSGLKTSVVGFGTWSIGGLKWGETDEDEALSALHRALDRGINLFDTAAVYGRGRSEQLLGTVAEDRRDDMVIATKGGIRIRTDGSLYCDTRPETLQEDLDRSRDRLNTDTIDLFQIQWPPQNGLSAPALHKLEEFVDRGWVNAIGVCHFPYRLLQNVHEKLPLDTVQLRFNMLEQDSFKQERSFCREHDISVLSCTSLAKGVLTGKYDECPTFPELDNRSGDPLFDPDHFSRSLDHVKQVLNVAEEEEKPASAVALNWTHNQPGIRSALAGMKTCEQVEQNVRAVDWELSEDQMDTLTNG